MRPYRDSLVDVRRGEQTDDSEDAAAFDRVAFAEKMLEILRPPGTRVVILLGGRTLSVESGRRWGHPGERWALVAIPERASKRAIALALAELSPEDAPGYTFDLLFAGS